MAQQAVAYHAISIRLACKAFSISETCYRYQAKLKHENEIIAHHLIELTEQHTDWGFGLCFDHLRHIEQECWNHKRVYRIYCELALNLRKCLGKFISHAVSTKRHLDSVSSIRS